MVESSPSADELKPERVQKVMSRLGLASRRASEELITEGRVQVNGQTATLGDRITPVDELKVDGQVFSTMPAATTYLLNKPAGYVTTSSDPQGRRTVLNLINDDTRVFPVGRLDMETEGLLLLTNDGDLTHRLTHPSFGVEKEYISHVKGRISRASIRQLRQGLELEDGMTAPAKVSSLEPGVIKIIIHEGRNRQVRRMFEAVGHPVKRLIRTRIGPISDSRLAPGEYRRLSAAELLELQRSVVQGL